MPRAIFSPSDLWFRHFGASYTVRPATVLVRSRLDSYLKTLKAKEEMTNIFVGNLNYNATEDSVRSLFEQYGAVERVNIVTDRDTGQPRGFAFVEMTNSEEARRAIEGLNGQDLGGRALNVNEARPKSERGPRGGFGNRRSDRSSRSRW